MKTLKIEGSNVSPKVLLDPENLVFEISGYSRPEDASGFYTPIINWIESFITSVNDTNKPEKVIFTFHFIYFNSSSSKYIYDMIMLLSEFQKKGIKVIIKWLYDEDDDELFESGEELSEMSGVPFLFEEVMRE